MEITSKTKLLPEEFIGEGEVRDYEFKKVKETEHGFIYAKTLYGVTRYEVFKKKYNKRFDCISYPTSKAFGIWAWDVPTLERAEKRLKTFEENETKENK